MDDNNISDAKQFSESSISDVESLQNITSYRTSQSSEEFIFFRTDNSVREQKPMLEAVSEEDEIEIYEVPEEEDEGSDEEQIQSSYESGKLIFSYEYINRIMIFLFFPQILTPIHLSVFA